MKWKKDVKRGRKEQERGGDVERVWQGGFLSGLVKKRKEKGQGGTTNLP